MAIPKHVVALITAFALCGPACAAADAPQKVVIKGKRGPSTIVIKGVRDPSAWFRLESPHLVVYSDDLPEQAIELVENLERLDHVMRLYLRSFLVDRQKAAKITLVFQHAVNLPRELDVRNQRQAVGLVNSCESGTQLFASDIGRIWKADNARVAKMDVDMTLSYGMSMYAMNFLYRYTDVRVPQWFMTGASLYFGGMRFTDDRMAVGRGAVGFNDVLKDIDAGHRMKLLRFDQVLRNDIGTIGYEAVETSTPDRLTGEKFEVLQALSYNLMHYLLSSAKNRDKMAQYLELVNDGGDPAESFSRLFGMAGLGIDGAMERYRATSMKILTIDIPELPKPAMDITRLTRREGEFVLDNAVLKACPAPADGKAILERVKAAAAQVPAVDFAQLTLSRAQVDWGDPREAIPYLERAAKRDADNAEVRYLLGLAHLNLAAGAGVDKDGQLAAARANLDEAAALAPGAPEVSYARFRAGLMGTEAPTEQTMALAVDAWRKGHDVPAFARAAALANAWLGNAAEAYRAFNTLARSQRPAFTGRSTYGGHAKQDKWDEYASMHANWAERWLASLEQGVSRDALLDAMRREGRRVPGAKLGWYDGR
jgi:tetratricopeptide (TPR) repeat protein